MLNEEKIKLMTELAAFEKKDGKEYISICNYFKIDYITFNMIKSAIAATIAFCIGLALWVFYEADFFVNNIHMVDLLGLGEDLIKYYVIFLVAYLLMSYVVFSYKYKRAKKAVRRYYGRLKRMSKLYEKEEQKLGNSSLGRGK